MGLKKAVCGGVLVFALSMLLPVQTFAQAGASGGIAGSVKDTTGAVLPGVTVEASSPALIEKVRTVVTDDQGLYNITDLRPGEYVVMFSLPGFSSVRREGIELTASFTATVSVEMRVGSVEETITVTGAAPTVDVQNVVAQKVMTREVINALPTGTMSFQNLGVLIPGVTTQSQDVGGTAVPYVNIAVHGGRTSDTMLMLDGMSTSLGNARSSNGPRLNNSAAIQETSLQTGAMSAETVGGGVRIDVVHKDGGNRFSGAFYGAFTNHRFQSDNLSDELKARGLASVDRVETIFDFNPGFGGPIKKDKLWFFMAVKRAASYQQIAGMFSNKSTDPFAYVPDLTRPAIDRQKDGGNSLRLTWQVNGKNKINLHYMDTQGPNDHWYGAGGDARLTAPEAINRRVLMPYSTWSSSWSAPLTSRLLLEAGATFVNGDFQSYTQPGVALETPSIKELRSGYVWGNFSGTFGHSSSHQFNERIAASYITGSHTFKVGLQLNHNSTWYTQNVTGNSMTLQLLDGAPRQVTVFATPLEFRESTKGVFGLFAQDQWKIGRAALNLGVRFDRWNAYVPALHLEEGRFVPARDFPAVYNVPNFKNISPRLGLAYDLFGSSKTAVKVNVAKYVEDTSLTVITRMSGAASASVTSATRPWTDANRDFIPQESELGALSNSNFGKTNVTRRYDPDVLDTRFTNWEMQASLQHELLPMTSVEVGYFRRWYDNFSVTDNLDVGPADFDTYCVTAPTDSRLPNGGGYQICGLYDVKPAKFAVANNNLVAPSSRYGTQREVYDGVDMNMNARLPRGMMVSGGVSLGRTRTERCFVVDSPQELQFCDVRPPFLPQVKFIAVYPLPWFGLQASATVQSIPGPNILANYTMTSAQILPTLGRNLSSGANGNAVISLVEPGTLYGDRLNQIDFRMAKIFRVGPTRIQGAIDLYNMFNASPVLALNNTYSATAWQRPTQNLQGRLLRFGAQLSF